MSALREIAGPFVVAPPAGMRVRTRLRVSGIDAAVLREVGGYLGSLASADLAARCAEGRLDVKQHAKTIRIQTFRTRLAEVERQLDTGRVSVCRGRKALLRKRNNLAEAGLTETRWRERWAASRLFITADGEKDKTWGNETIRWNPDQDRLEIRLPAPLARLANRPSGRYRLSCLAGFTYRGGPGGADTADR